MIKRILVLILFVHVQFVHAQTESSLTEGLVAYWALDENTGTLIIDKTANSLNGNIINGTWKSGYVDEALYFDTKQNGYIDLGKKLPDLLRGASQLTFAGWINNTNHPAFRYDIFQTFTGSKVGFHIGLGAMGELTISGRSDDSDNYFTNAFNYTSYGVWTHFVAIIDYENNLFEAYINGSKVAVKKGGVPNFKRRNYNPTVIQNSNFNDFVGGLKNNSYTFNGGLDEIRLYKRKLTVAEIFELARPDLNPNTIAPQDAERVKVETIKQLMSNNIACYNGRNHGIVGDKRVLINSENAEVAPFRQSDKLYLPISFFASQYHSTLQENSVSERILTLQGETIVKITSGSTKLLINDIQVDIGAAVLVKNEEFYLPAEAIAAIYNKNIYLALSGDLVVIGNDVSAFKKQEVQPTIALMPAYFLPKNVNPKRSISHTRQELLYLPPNNKRYVNNPTIERLQDGTLIASCTSSGVGFNNYFYKSTDGGQTWEYLSAISGTLWATLFEHNEALYLLGNNRAWGDIVIRKSTDKGKTWSAPLSSCDIMGILYKGGNSITPPNHHAGPTSVLKANGRIYKAVEDNDPRVFPLMKTFIISAADTSDLMNPASWTATEKLSVDFNLWKGAPYNYIQPGWLEGNAVQAPDGNIWNIIRVNSLPYSDKAAVQRMSADGKKLEFNYQNDIIDFPGGLSKFSIKFDPKTRKYYSLVNNSVDTMFTGHRCVLSLSVSEDLINWRVVETLLYDDHLNYWDDTLLKVGYQYADFVFDGDNIVMVIRESWGDSANYHDANRFTSYILKDYAKYVQ